jgi:hypothetical protein
MTDRASMEAQGFFVSDRDLEDELVQAVGATQVEQVIAACGDAAAWALFQQQPTQRGAQIEDQMRAFIKGGGRKVRYASALVDALNLSQVPRSLAGVVNLV